MSAFAHDTSRRLFNRAATLPRALGFPVLSVRVTEAVALHNLMICIHLDYDLPAHKLRSSISTHEKRLQIILSNSNNLEFPETGFLFQNISGQFCRLKQYVHVSCLLLETWAVTVTTELFQSESL